MSKENLEEFIELVKKRPGMYVFSEGATEFDGLVRGYSLAKGDNGRGIISDFNSWLKKEKYPDFENFSVSWCRILLFHYSCEKRALEQFFEFWDEFQEQRP